MQTNTTEAIFAHIEQNPRDIGAYADMVLWLKHLREQRTPNLDAGRKLRELLFKAPEGDWADVLQMERLLLLLRESFILDAQDDLDCFMQAMEFDRPAKRRFWYPRRHRLWQLCQELQNLETNPDARGLIVAFPPRTGKSTTCGFAMAWHMGRNPWTANLMISYSDTICQHFFNQATLFCGYTETMGRKAKKITSEYTYAEIFPDSLVFERSAATETLTLSGPQAYPTLTCRSLEGTLTGATEVGEGGWLYADDLVKNLEEAMSPLRMEKKWQSYVNQAYDRRKEGSKLLNVGTIWDVNDPQMRMMRIHDNDPAYRKLIIPALDPKTGESNFEYLYGVGFSKSYYLDMKSVTDDITWAAKYEGRPRSRKGQLYPAESLERYLDLPSDNVSRIVAVADTKDHGEDFCVVPIAFEYKAEPERFYIVDCICDDGSPDALRERVCQILQRYGVQTCRFESNSAGGRFAEDVQKMCSERDILCHITKKYTGSNKETRILASSSWVINHCVFRDQSLYAVGSDYSRFMEQMVSYTLEGKVNHDDAPDAMSMLADMLASTRRAKARIIDRPY